MTKFSNIMKLCAVIILAGASQAYCSSFLYPEGLGYTGDTLATIQAYRPAGKNVSDWCANCAVSAPCTATGSGALAINLNGTFGAANWTCVNPINGGSGGISSVLTDSTILGLGISASVLTLNGSTGGMVNDLNGSFNKTINVEAPTTKMAGTGATVTLGAVGNGTTNDYAALQGAIDAACGGDPTTGLVGTALHPFPVELPPGIYLHNMPLVNFCGLDYFGHSRGIGGESDPGLSRLTQNYWGVADINEGPGASNFAYTTALRTCTGAACGAIDARTDAGSGHYLALSPFIVRGPAAADIANASTLAFKVVLQVPNLSTIGNGCVVDYKNVFGNTLDTGVFRIELFNLCVNASGQTIITGVTGGSSQTQGNGTSTDTGFSAGSTHELLGQMDGSFLTAFRDGIPVVRVALTGNLHNTIRSGNGNFNMLNFPSGGGNETYPEGNNGNDGVKAIYDSYRVENAAVITTCPLTSAAPVVGTACYTPGTTQDQTTDTHTILLINGWKQCTSVGQTQCSVMGTQYAQTGLTSLSPTGNVYLPVLTGNGPSGGVSISQHMHNLEFCDNTAGGAVSHALVATWMFNSEWDHLHCGNNTGIGFDFFSNDWDSYVHDSSVFAGKIGFAFGDGNHFGESSVDRILSIQTQVHEVLSGPGIRQSYSEWQPQGYGVLGWYYDATKLDDDFSFMDAEESDPNMIGTVGFNANYGLMNFTNFEGIENPNQVEPPIWMFGHMTSPIHFHGASGFQAGTPMVIYQPAAGVSGYQNSTFPIIFDGDTSTSTGVVPSDLVGCSAAAPWACGVSFENDPYYGNNKAAYNHANYPIYACTANQDGAQERVSDATNATAATQYTTGGGSSRAAVSCIGSVPAWENTGGIW